MKKKTIISLSIIFSLLIISIGCVQNPGEQNKNQLTIKDDKDRNVSIPKNVDKVISLAPSNTETLFALGEGPKVVGVTEYADYPSEVKYKEMVGGFQNPSIEKIISLNPDVVFASTRTGEQTVEILEKNNISVYVTNPDSLSDIYENIEEIGKIMGKEKYAERLTSEMKERTENITKKVSDLEEKDVFYLMSTYGGTWTAGKNTFINKLIMKAGGNNIADDLKGYKKISKSTVIEEDPDLIITTKHCYTSLDELKNKTGWKELTAIQEDKFYTLTENKLVRPGPRIIDGLEEVAQVIHPDAFQ